MQTIKALQHAIKERRFEDARQLLNRVLAEKVSVRLDREAQQLSLSEVRHPSNDRFMSKEDRKLSDYMEDAVIPALKKVGFPKAEYDLEMSGPRIKLQRGFALAFDNEDTQHWFIFQDKFDSGLFHDLKMKYGVSIKELANACRRFVANPRWDN